MKRQLGKAVGILMRFNRLMDDIYEDIRAFNAPSECYPDERAMGRSFRSYRRHACHVAGVKNLKQLRREVKRACPVWDRYNHFRLGIDSI